MGEEVVDKRKVSPLKSRFKDAVWFDELNTSLVTVIGCGGIGSNVIFALSRIGCHMILYDMDVVEIHNLGGQLFSHDCIGKYKTQSIIEVCQRFCGESIYDMQGEYLEDSYASNIVIAAVDNMKVRKIAFENWVKYRETLPLAEKQKSIFIDGRLLMEDYQVYAVNSDEKIAEYRKTLFDDSVLTEEPCTMKATTHCSLGIASEIVSILTNHVANQVIGDDIREVPFSITKSIQSYTYKIADKFEET